MTTSTDFAATYAEMPDGELARVLRNKHSLVPEAVSALDREIQKRNLDPTELRKLKPHSIDPRRKPTEVEKRMKGKWLNLPQILVVMALSLALALFLDHFGVLKLYWPVVITIIVPVFTVWGFWELKNRPWFWVAIAIIVVANATLFGMFGWPWGEHWVPGREIAGFCFLESVPIFALIAHLQKRIDRNRGSELDQPTPAPHSSPTGKIDTNPS